MATDLHLGSELDSESPMSLETSDFTTHAVVFGMTGSGKTGLCISLLEELVFAGVPIIAIDPKGDMSNLALVFPQFQGSDFAPWVDEAEATRAGLSVEAYAQQTADKWKAGLAKGGIDEARVQTLKDRMELTVYTPGSDSGVSVDVLGALRSPPAEALEDEDIRRELVSGMVSSLLGLVGVKADPMRSPEHVVLSKILDEAWAAGQEMDLETLVLELVDPPFKKAGVFPIDKFFAPDARMALAMRFNGVIASPTFAPWRTGVPLDPERLTTPVDGKVPVSIFHLAHLSDTERFFFATLLLERMVAWSRAQPGASDLRAALYFDEVFGFLPPHPHDPPTKKPILTLMKQARAVGFGVILATQNPVDIDYKAMSNAGTWFVGRLDTGPDRKRVSEGLASSGGLTKSQLDDAFGKLGKRKFMVHRAKWDAPKLFHTRHAISWLRGPVTRPEIERLPKPAWLDEVMATSEGESADTAGASAAALPEDVTAKPPKPLRGVTVRYLDPRVAFSARLDGVFSRFAEPPLGGGSVLFRPALYAELTLTFDETRSGFVHQEVQHQVYFPMDASLREEPLSVALELTDLLDDPPADAHFAPLPEDLDASGEFTAVKKSLVDRVYRSESRGQWVNKTLKLYGKGGETRGEFDARVSEIIEDQIDEKVGKLKDKYEVKAERLEDKIRSKEAQLVELESTHQGRKMETMVSAGEMIFSIFGGGRKSISSVMSKRRQATSAAQRIESASVDVTELKQDLEDLLEDLEEKVAEIEDKARELADQTEARDVGLEKNDIAVRTFGILWIPVSRRV